MRTEGERERGRLTCLRLTDTSYSRRRSVSNFGLPTRHHVLLGLLTLPLGHALGPVFVLGPFGLAILRHLVLGPAPLPCGYAPGSVLQDLDGDDRAIALPESQRHFTLAAFAEELMLMMFIRHGVNDVDYHAERLGGGCAVKSKSPRPDTPSRWT